MEFDWMIAVKAAVVTAIGAFTAFWGYMGWLVAVWVALMFLDYVTGSAAAAVKGNWSSSKSREGIVHKAGELVVVIVAAFADVVLRIVMVHVPATGFQIPEVGLLLPMVLVWYIVTELGSIIENAAIMGAPVPAWLIKLMKAGKDAVDAAGDKLVGSDNEQDNDREDNNES